MGFGGLVNFDGGLVRPLDAHLRLGEAPVDIPPAVFVDLLHVCRFADPGSTVGHGLVRSDDMGEGPVFDLDEVEGFLGGLLADRRHSRDLFSLVLDPAFFELEHGLDAGQALSRAEVDSGDLG